MVLEVNDVYRVELRKPRNDASVEEGKRAVVYFPVTGSLYLSIGSEVFFTVTQDSTVTNAFTMITKDGFSKTFRVPKDGSGCYFEKGGYVSLFVESSMPRTAIENLVADILTSAESIRKTLELQRKEKALLQKLQEVRDELQAMDS